MMRTRWAWIVASLLLSLVVATPSVAPAAFSPADLQCRERLSKNGTKLATKASKELSKCHKRRSAGKIDGTTNCNSIAAVDTKGSIGKVAAKLVTEANAMCAGLTPSNLGYTGCPSPCEAAVPAITTFQNVADCIVCVAENHAQTVSFNGQGNPATPLLKDEAQCHAAIGKGQTKLLTTIVKERTKCQTDAERAGAVDTATCISADPNGKIQKAADSARAGMDKSCTGVTLSSLDSCSFFSRNNLKDCVLDEARVRGRLMFRSFYELAAGGGVTTTTSSTTTSLGGGTTTTSLPSATQDPKCPNLGELTLLAGVGVECASNGDCLAGTCDAGLGRCVTGTELDTGWTGIAHDADINDKNIISGNLLCPGPASPTCGQCDLKGLSPRGDVCRCANDNRQVCDQPFVADADDCGGEICNCYFGAPLPLSAGNVAACVVNRFSKDISGTANVDTGAGVVNVNLASVVFLGPTNLQPCPSCGGTCTAPPSKVGQTCGQDIDCDSLANCTTNGDCLNPGGTCVASKCFYDGACSNFDPTPNDGARGGTCYLGENDGLSCDIQASNTTFPAPQAGGYSLDCFPSVLKNVSGTGLKIKLSQTTGSVSLSSKVLCGYPGPPLNINYVCPCGVCISDTSTTCTTNADCPGSSCARLSNGVPMPNQCEDGVCSPTGNEDGECSGNEGLDKYCDGVLRANGEGLIACLADADCSPGNVGVEAGACALLNKRECFLDPIVGTGVANASKPLGAAVFCAAATSSNAINNVTGLPGPGRVRNQASSRLFCASNPAVLYEPGVGGCP